MAITAVTGQTWVSEIPAVRPAAEDEGGTAMGYTTSIASRSPNRNHHCLSRGAPATFRIEDGVE